MRAGRSGVDTLGESVNPNPAECRGVGLVVDAQEHFGEDELVVGVGVGAFGDGRERLEGFEVVVGEPAGKEPEVAERAQHRNGLDAGAGGDVGGLQQDRVEGRGAVEVCEEADGVCVVLHAAGGV